jgi:hypothetical protein
MIRESFGAALLVAAVVSPAAAQGNGHGHGHAYGQLKSSTSAPSSGGAAQVQPGVAAGVRNFGSWLDDASIMAPGSGSLTLSFGWYRSPLFHEFDAPVADGGIGLARRVQFGFSVPYYHVNEPGGPVFRGLGDLYLSSKVQLWEPSAEHHGLGFAVIPVVEMLSSDPAETGKRFNWAAPVSMELQREGWRVFGSAGYFSQGSLFASGAIEVALSQRITVTGTLTQSHSTIEDDPGVALPLSRTRRDVSGGAAWMLNPGVALFGNVGRTISQQDANAATVVVSGGVSFNFDAWHQASRRSQ